MISKDPRNQIEEILKRVGAIKKNGTKHVKWLLPGGKIFVLSQNPSSRRSTFNYLTELKKLLRATFIEHPDLLSDVNLFTLSQDLL